MSDYLDHKTAVLDNLIAQKQRLIELLQEERTAVISTAVTQGLNPDAPRKPSGIPWLGDIPAHWDVFPLRRLKCLVQTGPFGSQLHASDYVENKSPVINPAHILDGEIIPDQKMTVDAETKARLSRHIFQKNDIVLGRRGELGRAALITEREEGWLCGTGSLLIRLYEEEFEAAFLTVYLGLPEVKDYFSVESVGSTMDNLNTTMLLKMPLLVPSRDEQIQILAHCRQETDRINRNISQTEKQIALLREYRTTLISHAVTGKIDVRTR